MKLALLTDTHLDCVKRNRKRRLGKAIRKSGAEAVVITGDISVAGELLDDLCEVRYQLGVVVPIYYVLGNHDIWGSSFEKVHADLGVYQGANATWLETVQYVPLGKVALIGVDGWYDGKCGTIESSNVLMNDWERIAELKYIRGAALQLKLAELGADSAATFRSNARAAIAYGYRSLLVATHVPPFRESARWEGKVCDNDHAPFYVNKQLGDALISMADDNPDVSITVLCGHAHEATTVHVLKNLVVHTGAAEYGAPRIAGMVDVDGEGVAVTV